jgi:hypothetical protein
VDVIAGDVIRVASSAAPTNSTANILNITLQEQSVQVSVSNTLPQYSESDLVVKAAGNAGQTATANVTDIPFIAISDSTNGAWNGSTFSVGASGTYTIAGSIFRTTSGQPRVYLYVNGVQTKVISTLTPSDPVQPFVVTDYFTTGQILSIRTDLTFTLSNNSMFHWLNITSVGKPNVTGVNVVPFVNVAQPDTQSFYLDNLTNFTSGSTVTGAPTTQVGSGIFSYNSSTGLFTALKTANIDASGSFQSTSAGAAQILLYLNSTFISVGDSKGASAWCSVATQLRVVAGDTFKFVVNAGTSGTNKITVTATAFSDQILTAPQTFSTDTAALQYASSAAYTLSTLSSAPAGTYITYTYTANTVTLTQTTTRPTQTDADMNTNGIQLFGRAKNVASTFAQPSYIAVQIGKGMQGLSVSGFEVAGKASPVDLSYIILSSTADAGIQYAYNPTTGILVMDAGWAVNATTTRYTGYTVGSGYGGIVYVTIAASKNPALTGMNINKVMARAVNTSGQSVTTNTVVTYDTTKIFDTHGALNTATGTFTSPESGYYEINAVLQSGARAYGAGQGVYCIGYKNGVSYGVGTIDRAETAVTIAKTTTYNDTVYLAKGDTFDIRATNEAGATALQTGAGTNFFSITKASN